MVTYWLAGFFPFGTASYIIWPQTSAWELVTTLHHVWFIPLLTFVLRTQWGARFQLSDWFFGMLIPGVLVPLSNITPKTLDGVYLNINMCHEFWPDSPYEFTKMCNGGHPALISAFVVSFGTFLNFFAWSFVLFIQWALESCFRCKIASKRQSSKKKRE